ncbi:MT-A70 family methyltransferase [Thermodesulfobacteriota bacterium]
MEYSLIRWDKLKAEIATSKDIVQLSKLSIGLDAIQKWAKQSEQSLETQNEIAEFRLRLDRKRGQWINENIPERPGNPRDQLAQNGQLIKPTLKAAGIGHHESPILRSLADLSDDEFEQIISEPKEKNKELTRQSAVYAIKKKKREEARVRNAEIVEGSVCEKPKLNHYQTIVVDPPWDISELGDNEPFARSEPTYRSMTINEIIEERIDQYAADNCHLYLWAINRMIFAPKTVIEAWGFRYVTTLTWCKETIGMGNYYRNNTEHIFFCIKGRLSLLRNDVPTWHKWPRGLRGHSSKPDEFYDLVSECSPGPRLDYFARNERRGWDVYGGEL